MYVKRLKATDFRCFREVEVEFQMPGGVGGPRLSNVNLGLGTNAAGKSAMLKAIVVGILNQTL